MKDAVISLVKLDVSQLTHFQGELKDLSQENYLKLRKEIEEIGFSFAIHAWPHDEKFYILDGHQRVRTLTKMVEEGEEVPKVPVVLVSAADFKEAKRKVLAGTSQFGEMTGEGLYQFIAESGLDWRDVVEDYRFPEIDFVKFSESFYGEAQHEMEDGAEELGEGEFTQFEHVCPKCGFEWDGSKKKVK